LESHATAATLFYTLVMGPDVKTLWVFFLVGFVKSALAF